MSDSLGADFARLDAQARGGLFTLALLGTGLYLLLAQSGRLNPFASWELLILGVYALALHQLDVRLSGLSGYPQPNLRTWVGFGLKLSLLLGGWGLAITLLKAGLHMPVFQKGQGQEPAVFIGNWLWYACLRAPLLEEGLFRWMLCPITEAIWGFWPAILLSGSLFALAHVLAGNPGADNLVAGYFLAWAFLKSRSLWIPIGLHAAGNVCIGLVFLVWHTLA